MSENKDFKPYIPAEKVTPEITVTSVIVGVLLAIIFGAANAYLGLRVGLTVSASIPAAVISMAIIRIVMKKNSILESNIVQTIGSAGESLAAGAIFTENYNTKTFEDPNTVIYGHDMKNGSMFQSLHRYMDRSFFDANRDVTIYLPDKILHYKIFAAYLYDNRHLLMSFDFWNKEEYQQYLNNIFSMRDMNSFVDTSMEVTNEDKIITLSTCYAGISSQRYLVQAVLVSIDQSYKSNSKTNLN